MSLILMAKPNKIPSGLPVDLPFPVSELWTAQKEIRLDKDGYRMLLRALWDQSSGQVCYDILGGKKGEEPHIHYRYDLQGKRMFDVPRDRVHTSRLEVETQQLGKVSDDIEILKESAGKMDHIFQVKVNLSTKESWVEMFQIHQKLPSDGMK